MVCDEAGCFSIAPRNIDFCVAIWNLKPISTSLIQKHSVSPVNRTQAITFTWHIQLVTRVCHHSAATSPCHCTVAAAAAIAPVCIRGRGHVIGWSSQELDRQTSAMIVNRRLSVHLPAKHICVSCTSVIFQQLHAAKWIVRFQTMWEAGGAEFQRWIGERGWVIRRNAAAVDA